MMKPYIVVDASAAGAWLFSELYSAQAQPIIAAIAANRVIAIAPDRFEEELLRICQKKLLPFPTGSGLTPADSFGRFLDLMTAPIPFYLFPSQELHERAWQMATVTPGLTTHDALYLAMAERWGAELWTSDVDLTKPAAAAFATVRDFRIHPFPY